MTRQRQGSEPSRIERQILHFGYPLKRLVKDRNLPIENAYVAHIEMVRLVKRWHARYAPHLRAAGKRQVPS